MFEILKSGWNFIKGFGGVAPLFKPLKYWIDKNFRPKVHPVDGSVLYCDLLWAAEHSGIYIGSNQIANICVDGFAEAEVESSDPEDFTSKSSLHKRIYVSCNSKGAVGNDSVGSGAAAHIGERSFYGLLFSNCHDFSRKCLNYSSKNRNSFQLLPDFGDETWEPSIRRLKQSAKRKLGATKWLLWDWENDEDEGEEEDEEQNFDKIGGNGGDRPDQQSINEYYENLPLNSNNIEALRNQLAEAEDYAREISDENLPPEAVGMVNNFVLKLQAISKQYSEAEEFMKVTGCSYSFRELQNSRENYMALINEMKNNVKIKELTEKLGRNYISEWKKTRPVICKRTRNELFGIHKSNDLVRLLPSELSNFEDPELEVLFYAKYLENSLLTYELVGKTRKEINNFKKGPVIACLDTSGSMSGQPILKAKALLFAIAGILEKENRSLYVLMFGGVNQIEELMITSKSESSRLLAFLHRGFGGGTDFETPLKRSIEIISEKVDYNKADILLITDGLCSISSSFNTELQKTIERLDFSIYTVICNNSTTEKNFSDEVVNI